MYFSGDPFETLSNPNVSKFQSSEPYNVKKGQYQTNVLYVFQFPNNTSVLVLKKNVNKAYIFYFISIGMINHNLSLIKLLICVILMVLRSNERSVTLARYA
jgi:hypothetical protein